MSRESWARLRLCIAAIACCAACAVSFAAEEASATGFRVRYRSADTVYLQAGSANGLVVGDRLEVRREGRTIARVEIVFVAEHSSSCKILSEEQTIEAGDEAGLEGGRIAVPPPPVASAEPAEPEDYSTRAARSRPRTRFSGTISIDREQFTDNGGRGLDYNRTWRRLSLRVTDIARQPLHFRLRLRTLEYDRARSVDPGVPLTASRDRLFEASLTYAPSQGRYWFSVGRLGASPFVSIGYLDGALGQVRVGGGFDVGAFVGGRPVIQEFGLEDSGIKYGAYTRWRSRGSTGPRGLEIFLAAIREDGKSEVSREYAALEVLYRGTGKWTFLQHTEIDFNRGWRGDVSQSSTQLSNLSIVGTGRLSRSVRLILGYDHNQRYRTEDNRSVPEALFDDLWRQGFRARLQLGRPGGVQFSVNAGIRMRESDDENTTYVGAGIYDPELVLRGLLVGGDLALFSNPFTEGYMATARVSKTFRGGHQVGLVLGTREQEEIAFGTTRSDRWARLQGWIELPLRLFARAELEADAGDDLDGRRINAGLGYRF